jgi:Mn-dependent DtxR family transcriptional regulator
MTEFDRGAAAPSSPELSELVLYAVANCAGSISEVFHEDLAEMIGCSRPMVSRMIAQMAESGLLDGEENNTSC